MTLLDDKSRAGRSQTALVPTTVWPWLRYPYIIIWQQADPTILTGCAKISILVTIISLDFERATATHKVVRDIVKNTVTEIR